MVGRGKPPVRGKTSAYGFFVKMCYEEHKKKYPTENVLVTEISKKCSEKWKEMGDDEKRRFVELAHNDAVRHAEELAAYAGKGGMVAVDDGGTRKNKKRAKKDPSAPKRALSAFFFFSNEKRASIAQENKDWKVGQVAQELGRMWKLLTDEQKKVYQDMNTNDKARYENDMRDYQANHTQSASAQSSTMQHTPSMQPHQFQHAHAQQQEDEQQYVGEFVGQQQQHQLMMDGGQAQVVHPHAINQMLLQQPHMQMDHMIGHGSPLL